MDLYVKRPNIATCSPEPNCASTAKACFSQYRPTSTKVLTMLSGPLALQLSFFEVSALSGSLVSSAPERPCDDVCGLNALLSESGGDAADFLD
jgi:hypothetical protein